VAVGSIALVGGVWLLVRYLEVANFGWLPFAASTAVVVLVAAGAASVPGWLAGERPHRFAFSAHERQVLRAGADQFALMIENARLADTETNHAAAARARTTRIQSQTVDHAAIGAVTTFTIDIDSTSESWCLRILDAVAGHHDRYSHSPGYSALEISGEEPSSTLLAALAEYRLTDIAELSGGFRASTSDGQPAGSPADS
jgi:hypothetical protein